MKTARCFILTLFIFFTFSVLPNGFAQGSRPVVRLIYFFPNDQQPQRNMNTKMDTLIKDVQQIYADEMERHGFGRKTFRIETDATGKAVVHRIKGRFSDAYYQENNWDSVWDEISKRFDLSKNFYVTSIETRNTVLCGLGRTYSSMGGGILIPSSGMCFGTGATTHELGHAFRLDHDFRNDLYHMSYGKDWEKNQFSPCAAKWLDAHRAFNTAHAAVDEPATVKILRKSVVPSSNAMRLRFKVTDPNGLHQVQLKTDTTDADPGPGPKLIDCKSLSGESRTVEFVTTLLTPKHKRVYLAVMDVHGNFKQYEFPIHVPVQGQPSTTEVRVDASVDVLIYTGNVWWITRPAATAEAKTTKRLLQSAGIQAEITDNENAVKQWMLQTASDGAVDVLILYGLIPTTIYPPKNGMPEGSVAENWLETRDGNTILNHADYLGFWSTDEVRQLNGAGTLRNLMDIPGIFIPVDRDNIPMFVTRQGSALTPSLVNFQSDRAFPIDQLRGEWFAEKILASNTGTAEATLADPVIVRNGNRGRIAIVHQTSFEDNPKGEVAAEIIINYLLSEPTQFLELTQLAAQVSGKGVTQPPQLTRDVNADGVVNIQDLIFVASRLGKTGPNPADVNADAVVDIRDLVSVASALGDAAAAPSLYSQAFAMFTATDVQNWLTQAQYVALLDVTAQRGIRFLEQLLSALIPKESALLPNYPNPFNPETWIPYHLSKPTHVALTIYAIDGKVVRRLDLGHQPAGYYQSKSRAAHWDGRNNVGERAASGIYFYTLTAGEFFATKKMLILK